MKSRIFMYLFFFAVLFIIFQYMNEKSIFERQENHISSLRSQVEKADDSISKLNDRLFEATEFSLMGNGMAMDYLERLGFEAEAVQQQVAEAIYEQNGQTGDNPLIPYEGLEGAMKINTIFFLNHRWIIADFTDGTYWGEMLLSYIFDENNQLQIDVVSSVLYPR